MLFCLGLVRGSRAQGAPAALPLLKALSNWAGADIWEGRGLQHLTSATPKILGGTAGYLPENSTSFQVDIFPQQAFFSLSFPPCFLQLSPGKSEKFRSEMRIRLGSQSGDSKAKGTHQV